MQKFLLIVLSLLLDYSLGLGFNCYVGSSSPCYEPPCIYTTHVSFESGNSCYRYEKPICSGCACEPQCNSTTGPNCYDGCDEISIQNATYVWYYGVEVPGQYTTDICTDIPNGRSYFKWYRNATCCKTDLCNYPINGARLKAASLLGLVVTIHAILFVM